MVSSFQARLTLFRARLISCAIYQSLLHSDVTRQYLDKLVINSDRDSHRAETELKRDCQLQNVDGNLVPLPRSSPPHTRHIESSNATPSLPGTLQVVSLFFSLHSTHNDCEDTIPGERLRSIGERFDLWKSSQPSQLRTSVRWSSLLLASGWHVPLFTGDRTLVQFPTCSVLVRKTLFADQGKLSSETLTATKTA
jgi:hypothetical protein